MRFDASVLRSNETVKLDPLKCADGSVPNVLLAEDSPAARILTGALLKRIGCNVDAAEHGEEALDYVQTSSYDLILMDIEMPVMDGVVAAREIRTLGGEISKTPIIALSAFLSDTKKSSHWHEYFDVALSKPAGKHQLHSTIGKVLRTVPVSDRILESSNNNQPQPVGLIDLFELQIIRGDLTASDWSSLLKTASDEMEMVSRKVSHHHVDGNLDGLGHAAHQLSGLAVSFAAKGLHKAAVCLRVVLKDGGGVDNLEQGVKATCEMARDSAQLLRQLSLAMKGSFV